MHIQFLFGTETGTAEVVCEDLQSALPGDITSDLANLEDTSPATLSPEHFHVIVCSTFGSGDLPSSAEDFYETLKSDKPDLSEIRFAIFGLGDKTFGETFNQGSEKLTEALLACKATQIGDRGLADASGIELPEDVAIPWLEGILAEVHSA